MTDHPALDQIRKDIADNDVVVFMKGNPSMPQCGFSATVVQVLNHLGVAYKGVNVLERDRKSTRLNSSHLGRSRMPSSA